MDNISTITYDEDWQDVGEREYIGKHAEGKESEDKAPERGKKPGRSDYPKQYLIAFQLALCIMLALIAFVVKSVGGELYSAAHEWYTSHINQALIFDPGRGFDHSSLINTGTPDEV